MAGRQAARDVAHALRLLMNHPFILITAMAASVALIPVLIRIAPRLGMIDHPDKRKVHALPVSRVGGIGIVIGAVISMALWLPMEALIGSYLVGAAVLLAFGAWDDARELGHYTKFVGQFLAVLPVVYVGDLYVWHFPFLGLGPIPSEYAKPLTVFSMVGLINAINHSDGLDGLAGGEALLSLLAISMLAYLAGGGVTLGVAMATIGGVLGFLRFNAHPAQVFMGDGGSQFLGFTLGFLTVQLTQQVNTALSAALPALLIGLPVVDILAVLFLRARSGTNWFRATKNHVHHRLLGLGFGHYESVVVIYSIQALFVLNAVWLRYEEDGLIVGLYLAICAGLFFALTLAERTRWRLHGHEGPSQFAALMAAIRARRVWRVTPAWIVAIGVPAYLLTGSVWVDRVPRDFAVASAILFVVMCGELLFGRHKHSFAHRAAVYAAAMFVVYLIGEYPPALGIGQAGIEFWFFAVLGVAILLSVRYDRENVFRTTPLDYLMILLSLGVGIVSDIAPLDGDLGTFALKTVIVMYGCEVLLLRVLKRWSGLNFAALLTLGVLGVRGLI